MEPASSLPCSQEPATGPYPKTDDTSQQPHRSTLFFKIHSIIILPTCLFPSDFATKIVFLFLISKMFAACPTDLI
jgi:hypothetical protein